MKIAIDLRSLHTSSFSGVESYTVNVLEHLLPSDHDNTYTLFYNSFRRKRFDNLHFINAHFKHTRWPNRLLNASLKLFGKPSLEKLTGPIDVLFLPNLNLFSVWPRTKVLLTVHDLSPVLLPEMYNIKSRLWHWLLNYKKAVKRADKIFAVSEYTKYSLIDSLQVPADKIVVTPLGVDHTLYNPNISVAKLRDVRNRYSLPGDYILFVGTIEPRKNLANLLQAFEQLKGDTQLVIAGKLGWKYDALLDAIAVSQKKRQIKMLGYINEADKPAIIKQARAFVWPSLYEGFGLPVLEAMAVGTPVITSNVTSIPEVVGDAAVMVNPYVVEDITQGIEHVLENETYRMQLIGNGLHRAQQFSWDITALKVLETIKQL